MNTQPMTIDGLEFGQPHSRAVHAEARVGARVDLGPRFVACLMLGLSLSGAAFLSQALCSYNRLTASAAVAAPVSAGASLARAGEEDGRVAPPCEQLAHLAPARPEPLHVASL
ncbi:hypothetical protein [Ancylobacter oerskovii]|uniref:Uncharacterized protein n=1 Tax=Ancylobacter oerskovii TaxID=459519 RepID=A0ABW4YW32_9HYPH|nr:hypothetical protein [Ancylobacter oerskovii]MBS7544274.1 hypothetical protein [Ancylobacter oerskovii]